MKTPEPEIKAQRKVKKENPWELSSENYDLVYHYAEKLRFIGILAYPKIALGFNSNK